MKDMIKRIREEREGFTLAELLIVVAIIAVLVAIAIPVFNSQLEKSREATDAANLRAAYAEVTTAAITDNDTNDASDSNIANVTKGGDATNGWTWSATVTLCQQENGWQTSNIPSDGIGGVKDGSSTDDKPISAITADVKNKKTITVTYNSKQKKVTFTAA